jgi:hypothetical protein
MALLIHLTEVDYNSTFDACRPDTVGVVVVTDRLLSLVVLVIDVKFLETIAADGMAELLMATGFTNAAMEAI